MTQTKWTCLSVSALAIAVFLTVSPLQLGSQQDASIRIDADDIGGVVTSSHGPEAGVWIIAETPDLPTWLAKIVVTDERGRYVIPDLPKANYSVWVRGYGLVDSPKVRTAPGKTVNLKAVVAPNEALRRSIIPRSIGTRCSRFPTRANFPAPATKETACRKN